MLQVSNSLVLIDIIATYMICMSALICHFPPQGNYHSTISMSHNTILKPDGCEEPLAIDSRKRGGTVGQSTDRKPANVRDSAVLRRNKMNKDTGPKGHRAERYRNRHLWATHYYLVSTKNVLGAAQHIERKSACPKEHTVQGLNPANAYACA